MRILGLATLSSRRVGCAPLEVHPTTVWTMLNCSHDARQLLEVDAIVLVQLKA